jgi:hypothetical protein
VGAERLVRPIWTDLGAAEAPFLQSTWAGSASVMHDRGAGRLHGYVSAGHCRDRALAANEPFEDLWLRDGFSRDPEPYIFTVAGLEAQWRFGHWVLSGEGFGSTTNDQSAQPRFDPAIGARGEVSPVQGRLGSARAGGSRIRR